MSKVVSISDKQPKSDTVIADDLQDGVDTLINELKTGDYEGMMFVLQGKVGDTYRAHRGIIGPQLLGGIDIAKARIIEVLLENQ